MKKFLIVLLLFLTYSVFGASFNITIQNSGNIYLVSSTGKTKMLAALNQNSEGKIRFALSPIWSFSDNGLYLGELKFTNWKIQNVTTPSMNPQYAGLAFKRENWTIFASNPVFCPFSDKAVGIIFDYNSDSFGLILKSAKKKDTDQTYQIDWNEIDEKELVGAFTFSISKELFKHNLAIDAEFNDEQSIKYSISKKNLEISYSRILDNSVSQVFAINFKGFLEAKFTINKDKLSKYSGVSQSGLIQMESTLNLYNFTIKCISSNVYSKDGGRTDSTVISLKYSDIGINAEVSTSINRTEGTSYGLTFPEVGFSSENVEFSVKNKKTYLTLKFSEKAGPYTITFSISQNRKYSITIAID